MRAGSLTLLNAANITSNATPSGPKGMDCATNPDPFHRFGGIPKLTLLLAAELRAGQDANQFAGGAAFPRTVMPGERVKASACTAPHALQHRLFFLKNRIVLFSLWQVSAETKDKM